MTTGSAHVATRHGDGARVLELPRCALVVLNGGDRGAERQIGADAFRIGKSTENDLVLADDTVSRTHCEIVREKKGYLLRDLGSTNGTKVDGTRIKEVYLAPGALISVGKVEIRVKPYAERIELLPSERDSFGEAVGSTVAMREIFGLLERLAPTDATVLLGGESGTGKDVLARAIHQHSRREGKPFVVVDCGAVVGTLVESELFGHERGAFTGATATRQGAFELANGGTLFLDEIGELPLDLQPKLLRALEQRSFRRVGGNKEIRVDIRVIAASKRNLKMEVERGKFREDLYFRLAVVPVDVPPLRERRADVPRLVASLLDRFSRTTGRPMRIRPEVVEALRGHDWPGNVRELRNVIERAAYMADALGKDEVLASHLPFAPAVTAEQGPSPEPPPPFDDTRSYRENKARFEEEFERRYVAWLLAKHDGNISAAARAADMDRKYLHKLAKRHGLHPKDADD